jgi:hypothetical protein
MQTDLEE